MSTLSEISNAVEILISSGNSDIVILHCVSLYPTNVDDINLRNIEGLRDVFPDFPIGFSDHSLGTEISIASVALGAAVIEKHFTLDRAAIGMDNHMAIEIDDLQFLVNSCANVSRSLGMVERNLSSLEMDQRVIMRRSAVAAEDMIAGHVVDSSDICFKRPGNGISPDDMKLIIGKRLKRNVKGDTILALNDFE
jgi:N-acetylneuraminate synthase